MIKVYIDNVYSRIVGTLPQVVVDDLYNTLSYELQNKYFIPKVRDGHWDGVIRLFDKNKGQRFYTGLLGFVRDIFDKHGVEYIRVDNRNKPEQNLPELKFTPNEEYEEREYQQVSIKRGLSFTRGVFEIATGGGKTTLVAELISRIKTGPAIFFVPTKDLMDQAHSVLSSNLNTEIGMIGDGKCDIKDINVMIYASAIFSIKDKGTFKISDYVFDDEDTGWKNEDLDSQDKRYRIRELISSAQFVFFDECHHAASKTVLDILSYAKSAYWRYGGSATPYREANDEILIQAMFGGKIVEINASYLIKQGYLVKPDIFFVPVEVDVPYRQYSTIYKHAVQDNDDYNKQVANIINFFESRGLKNLIFVQRIPHGKNIKKHLKNEAYFLNGKLKSKDRESVLNDFRMGKYDTLVATSLADEGLDVPSINTGVMAGLGKSKTRLYQRVGRVIRVDRKAKEQLAIFIVFQIKCKFLQTHANNALAILKDEPEFNIIKSKGIDCIIDEISTLLKEKNKFIEIVKD